jgi:hypothetical protein
LAGTDLGWREGMAQWQPLSQFAEFAGDLPTGAPPPPVAAVAASTSATPAPRSGLPWDERQRLGFLKAFIETLQMVLSRPSEAFTAMKRDGGFGEPIIFALVGGCAGAVVAFAFSLVLQAMGIGGASRNSFAFLVGAGIGSIVFIILVPLFIVIGLFIGAAIMHVCLMIVGGAKQSFETTFRVLAFSQGSTGVLQMIPLCGGLIALVWGIVVNCIGLARAHETDTWRAVLAVFLPLIVCCGGGLILAMMFGMLGALGQHGGQ